MTVADRIGVQQPRIMCVPEYVASSGDEAIELALMAGLDLDEWQRLVVRHALGERPDGKWAAKEVAIVVPRQNGKGSILETLELAGLFLLGERLIIHAAHRFDTSLEAFRRLCHLVESRDEFTRRVKSISKTNGKEGIELHGPRGSRISGGQRIGFRTRTKGSARGFTADRLLLDEAMDLPEIFVGDVLPTLSARPNPQVVYALSAVDQLVHEDGITASRIRHRALAGDDPTLAYFEWSAPAGSPEELSDQAVTDPDVWASANPALNIRIAPDHLEMEMRAMDRRTFAVERLGVGDWPRIDGLADAVIDLDAWESLTDINSTIPGDLAFSFDVSPDRKRTAISVAGLRADGLPHTEVIAHELGTGWVAARLAELSVKHKPSAITCDGASPAASLIPEIELLGVKVKTLTAKEMGQACGHFYDMVEQKKLRHLGQPMMRDAIRSAIKRPLGDAWAWSRKSRSVDISPLVASTLALWAAKPARQYRTQGWA